MSTELLTDPPLHGDLPDHIAIGFQDQTAKVVDDFMIDAQLRLAHNSHGGEALSLDLPIEDRVEIIKTALMPAQPKAEDVELTFEQKEQRRAEIFAWQERRRRFSRPILRFDAIGYPRNRY